MKNGSNEPEFQAWRKRVRTYALIICCVGLPIGIVMELPGVWILSIVGIVIAGARLTIFKKM